MSDRYWWEHEVCGLRYSGPTAYALEAKVTYHKAHCPQGVAFRPEEPSRRKWEYVLYPDDNIALDHTLSTEGHSVKLGEWVITAKAAPDAQTVAVRGQWVPAP